MVEPPPPSYNDVVGAVEPAGHGEPSAPPIGVARPARPTSPRPATPLVGSQTQPGYETGGSLRAPRGEGRGSTSAPSSRRSVWGRCMEGYVRFSLAHMLRMNLEPDRNRQDPELDVEAQFSRNVVEHQRRVIQNKMRLQCVSGWLWCAGVIIVLAYIGLPFGMIFTGLSGLHNCPHRNKAIPVCLITGGLFLAVTITLRAILSTATIGKNHNWCKSRNANSCSGGICALEVFFYALFTIYFVILIVTTYFVASKPSSECDGGGRDCDDYCSKAEYAGGVVLAGLQLFLLAVVFVYFGMTVLCNRCLRSQELE